MKVLVACERSGVVRDAFRALGHDAWSCDLLPSTAEFQGPHLEGDVAWWLTPEHLRIDRWDLLIAHPTCTFLCSSGLHWNTRRGPDGALVYPERAAQTEAAVAFVRMLDAVPIPRIAIENPIGCLSTRFRKPSQIIQPWQFGHDASKATCLWLRNLPLLVPTAFAPPRIVNGRKRWSNQTDSGQNRLAPSADRWALRSRTYAGIAAAMAAQWGSLGPVKAGT